MGVGAPKIRDPSLNLGVGAPNIGDPSPSNYLVLIFAQNYRTCKLLEVLNLFKPVVIRKTK